jgi:hypothetical protein
LFWRAGVKCVRRIRGFVEWDEVLCCAVAVIVVDGDVWPVDRELLEVGAVVPVQLRVEVGEESALEERVVCEVDAAD